MHKQIWCGILCLGLSACSLKDSTDHMRESTDSMKESTDRMRDSTDKMRDGTDQMRGSTDQMRKSTDELKGTSNDIKKESQHLSKRTDDLEAELSKKESYAMLLGSLLSLFGEPAINPESEAASLNPEPDLLLYAGAAVESMLFQFWKGDWNEDIDDLDLRFKFSTEVLMVKCLKHIPRTFEVDVVNPNRSYKAIASLGAKLDRMGDKYIANVASHKLTHLSLYDVMLTALRDRSRTTRQELLPKATALILQYRRESIYMLQLRHNYFPMMVLGRMTDFQDRNLFERFWMWAGLSAASRVNLNDPVKGAGPEELKEWTSWLKAATETRRALRDDLHISPEYNTQFAQVLAQIDFGQNELLALPGKKVLTENENLQVEFAKAYVAAVGEANAAVKTKRDAEIKAADDAYWKNISGFDIAPPTMDWMQ